MLDLRFTGFDPMRTLPLRRTAVSPDSEANTLGPEEAYRFARGEEVVSPSTALGRHWSGGRRYRTGITRAGAAPRATTAPAALVAKRSALCPRLAERARIGGGSRQVSPLTAQFRTCNPPRRRPSA
jgi:hypothetical protein